MSDDRRARATLLWRLAQAEQEIERLNARLLLIANCQDKRCSLCLSCLNAAGAGE